MESFLFLLTLIMMFAHLLVDILAWRFFGDFEHHVITSILSETCKKQEHEMKL